jgi:hypothetical protein
MKEKNWKGHANGAGAFYGLGLIGAAIYFLQRADTFSEVILGVVKAVVWPVFFVWRVFEFLRL